jgi:hypothetical protein
MIRNQQKDDFRSKYLSVLKVLGIWEQLSYIYVIWACLIFHFYGNNPINPLNPSGYYT